MEVENQNPTDASASPTEASAEVNWSSVDPTAVPENIVLEHPAYKALLSESIERRKTISELKKQIGEPKMEKSASADKNEPVAPVSTDALQAAMERLEALERQVTQERQQTQRQSIINEYKISAEDAELFLTAGDAETLRKQAKALSERKAPLTDNSPTGSVVPVDRMASMRDRIKARVTGEQVSTDIFDPQWNRNNGGGVINRK